MDIKNFETAYLNAGGKSSELEKENGEYVSSKAQMGWQMWQASAQVVPEGFEQAYSEIFSPIVKHPYPRLENGDYKYIEINQGWKLWQAATAQAVPEGFVLVPKNTINVLEELTQLSSYAEIVGGISVNRAAIRGQCDIAFNLIREFEDTEFL